MLFIWSNSFDGAAKSTEKSDRVIEKVEPIINPNQTMSHDSVSFIVRKSAHFLEFALLGFLCESFYLSFCGYSPSRVRIFMLFVPLYTFAVALADEMIQSFNDRTNSFTDVLIDFSGSVFGIVLSFVLALIISAVVKKVGEKRKKANEIKLQGKVQ